MAGEDRFPAGLASARSGLLGTECRTLPRSRLEGVRRFLAAHPDLLRRLPRGSHHAYLTLCSRIAHLRSREATAFFIRTVQDVAALEPHPLLQSILAGAVRLSSRSWALVHPYLRAVGALPADEDLLAWWTAFTLHLSDWDIDAAIALLRQTPAAVEGFGPRDLLLWGEYAAEAVRRDRRVSRAVCAYLEESVGEQRGIALPVWKARLDQAVRIAAASAAAAEGFVRLGAQLCLLLSEEEAERWVTEGLAQCTTEEDRVGYFSGTHQKALQARDGLASGVSLESRAGSLALLCEALLGQAVKVRSNASLIGTPGFTGGAATDGHTLYLPEASPSKGLFKLMALHQASLLEWEGWEEGAARGRQAALDAHLSADRRLLQRMPGLVREMEAAAGPALPPEYPREPPPPGSPPLPWWGDLLPGLVRDTRATVHRLVHKAEGESELTPEALEALVTYLMAEGQRDERALWERLQEVFDDLEFASPDPEELKESFQTFLYREWDAEIHDYKVDWCLVRQRRAKDAPNTFVEDTRRRLSGLITLIRRQFVRLKPESFRKLRAQEAGEELDLEALIPALVEKRAGGFLSDAVYIRRDKRVRDVAVLFLVDMSASTEERIGDRRVIDIEKEAMVLMAEALDSLGDPFAIYGFTSEGRFRVDLFAVKDFGEPYDERAERRLGSLEPRQFTRLGAVLRHGVRRLDGVDALIKLLVVLTDGRPYDLEYGNLDYGVADTKKALQEARRHRVHPFIITCDRKGAEYMKRICPHTQSVVVPRVEQLPTMLPAMYKRLTT